MVDELKAINLILRMIPYLKDLTGMRRREFFEKRITPLFTELQEAHDFYNQAFLDARDSFVNIKSENTDFIDHTTVLLDAETLTKLEKVKEALIRKRKTDEAVRGSLLYEAKAIFEAIKWDEERRFVDLVACYFLERGGIALDNDWLDSDIQRVISSDNGAITKWDTPARRLYKQLRETNNLEELLNLIDNARNNLNQDFMNARLSFKSVQTAIIQKT